MSHANTLVVLDFETTGLSPDQGDRAIEIGAVRIENGEVTASFQELMNPGRRVSSFIENYTGISNVMLREADSCSAVMGRFADFIGDANLLAHNASFDKRFLDAELEMIGRGYPGQFLCSLLVARRVYQDAPTHKLGDLVRFARIPSEGDFHRALFDSQMTAKLWLVMLDEIRQRTGLDRVPTDLIVKLQKTPKKKVEALLAAYAG